MRAARLQKLNEPRAAVSGGGGAGGRDAGASLATHGPDDGSFRILADHGLAGDLIKDAPSPTSPAMAA